MGIFNDLIFGRLAPRPTPRPVPKPAAPKPAQPAKMFDRPVSRSAFRQALRKDSGLVPGRSSYGKYSQKERLKFESDALSYKKFGNTISREEVKRAVKGLEEKRMWAKTYKDKQGFQRQIDYLNKIDKSGKK